MPQASARRCNSHPSSSVSRRCGQSCWRAPPPPASAACASAARAARAKDGHGLCFACWITAVAPATSTLRKLSSPARVILPSRVLPAVEWSFGVRPIQAAKCRPDGNICGSGAFITSVVAPIGPIPGIFASRRLSGVGAVPGHQLGLDLPSVRPAAARSRGPAIVNSSRASTGSALVLRDLRQAAARSCPDPWRAISRTPPHSRGSCCSAGFAV